jgi:hypothetical protein
LTRPRLVTSFFLSLLFFAAVRASSAQGVARKDSAATAQNNRSGTWSATTASGAPLMGTWTAVLDSTGNTVTGMWTLTDAQGRTVANGGWSAAKAATQWNGAWRANVAGKQGEYSGTWTAGVDLQVGPRFADLFERAATSIVSGGWRAGRQSGAWSIRALKVDGKP